MEAPLSDALVQLLDEFVGSIAQLEALLYLRAHPHGWLSPEQLASKLFIDQGAAGQALFLLSRSGLVQRITDRGCELYQYHPRDFHMIREINELAQVYASNPAPVIARILSKPAHHSLWKDLGAESSWRNQSYTRLHD